MFYHPQVVPIFIPVSDDDLTINYTPIAQQGPPGPAGPIGPHGEQGVPGPQGQSGTQLSLVSAGSNYLVETGDVYIGVNSTEATNITLSSLCLNGQQVIVKAEMAAPLGNRKVTIIPEQPATIDGKPSYTITVPWGSVTLIKHNNTWFII